MESVWRFLRKLLRPPGWLVLVTGLLAFGALGVVFSLGLEESVLAYPIYSMCVYVLVVVPAILLKMTNRARSAMIQSKVSNKIVSTSLVGRYLADREFRGIVSLSQGMGFNLLYGLYHSGVGMLYRSVWSLSLGLYYLGLGILRAYLLWVWHRPADMVQECRCFRCTFGCVAKIKFSGFAAFIIPWGESKKVQTISLLHPVVGFGTGFIRASGCNLIPYVGSPFYSPFRV